MTPRIPTMPRPAPRPHNGHNGNGGHATLCNNGSLCNTPSDPDPEIVTQETQIHRRLRDSGDTGDSSRLIETHRVGVADDGVDASLEDKEGEAIEKSRGWKKERAEWFRTFVGRPFAEFMIELFRYNQRHQSEDDWKTPIFHFVYLLRGHEAMKLFLSDAKGAIREVERVLSAWTASTRQQETQPTYGNTGDHWENWFGISKTDAKAEFTELWQKLRFRPGHDPLDQAVEQARKMRLILPEAIRDKRPVEDSRLLRMLKFLTLRPRADAASLPLSIYIQLTKVFKKNEKFAESNHSPARGTPGRWKNLLKSISWALPFTMIDDTGQDHPAHTSESHRPANRLQTLLGRFGRRRIDECVACCEGCG